jgi:hypothetical protein
MNNKEQGRDVKDMSREELENNLIQQNEKANFLIDQFHESAHLTRQLFIDDLKTMFVMIKIQHGRGHTQNTAKYNKEIEDIMELMSSLIIIEDS